MNDFKGLIFLGAYTIFNLVDSKLKVLSIYGSEDKVLNMKKYQKYKSSLPIDWKVIKNINLHFLSI